MRFARVFGPDFGVELRRCPHSPTRHQLERPRTHDLEYLLHYITVDDLCKAQCPVVAQHVESLCLHIRRVHNHPCQVIFAELCMRRLFHLFGDRLDCGRSIDGLGDTKSTLQLASYQSDELLAAHASVWPN